ncbi:hypothetical protein C3L23_06220 [Nautilia sp. PV-1]|uniref:hypothetical protein n=1 Tax=Nautilia sp. PV-1 TaxID=2579250 RepID=UPI000FDB3F33|nr:hypothetical protein [Nautilia sp. PV-1]AZV46882.1 hypothetical protein C3L23_06220 [Nautilia sp. PV-1]
MEVYAFAKNNETETVHILKHPGLLIYKHKTFDEGNLSKFIPYHPDIPGVLENNNFWGNIEATRLMAAYLANIGENVCGNCVRELYKNEYPDMD